MTTKRYELWTSDTGEATHWKLVACFESEKQAIDRANNIRDGYGAGCVEAWDAGRNVFLNTVMDWRC